MKRCKRYRLLFINSFRKLQNIWCDGVSLCSLLEQFNIFNFNNIKLKVIESFGGFLGKIFDVLCQRN